MDISDPVKQLEEMLEETMLKKLKQSAENLFLNEIQEQIHDKVHDLKLPLRIDTDCPITFTLLWAKALLCIHILEQNLAYDCFNKAIDKSNEFENIVEKDVDEIEKVIVEFIDIDVTLKLLQVIKAVNDGHSLKELFEKFELSDKNHSYEHLADKAKQQLSELILTL